MAILKELVFLECVKTALTQSSVLMMLFNDTKHTGIEYSYTLEIKVTQF